jgi:hypothetical protein
VGTIAHGLFLAIVVGWSRPPQSAPAPAIPDTAALPAGWSAHPVPSGEDWDCANAGADWAVTRSETGALAIARAPRRVSDPLPFGLPRNETIADGLRGSEFPGDTHVLPVDDGFIVGFDAGEFGGSAFWFSPRGDDRQRIGLRQRDDEADNVRALVPFGNDVLAFQGLSHILTDVGRVIRINRARDGRWRAKLFARLPSAPDAVVLEGRDRWIVATSTGILRLDGKGHLEKIWTERHLGHLYAQSAVRLDDGRIFVGMRQFVLRLTPRGRRFAVDVLIADYCSPSRCACKRPVPPGKR